VLRDTCGYLYRASPAHSIGHPHARLATRAAGALRPRQPCARSTSCARSSGRAPTRARHRAGRWWRPAWRPTRWRGCPAGACAPRWPRCGASPPRAPPRPPRPPRSPLRSPARRGRTGRRPARPRRARRATRPRSPSGWRRRTMATAARRRLRAALARARPRPRRRNCRPAWRPRACAIRRPDSRCGARAAAFGAQDAHTHGAGRVHALDEVQGAPLPSSPASGSSLAACRPRQGCRVSL
jgi:hypothetical protein